MKLGKIESAWIQIIYCAWFFHDYRQVGFFDLNGRPMMPRQYCCTRCGKEMP